MADLNQIFPGASAMAQRMRTHDWAATSLGDPAHWPEGLKTPLRMLLTSRFEMWLGWGPELLFFYNDAYVPTLGIKHPGALGRPFSEVWSEVYRDVEDQVALVRAGEATWNDALLLLLERSGYPEETYHKFSYSPLYDDDGSVAGMLCVVSEETERIISERRLATLQRLGMELVGVDTVQAVTAAVRATVEDNRRDFPFALVRLTGAEGVELRVCTPDAEPLFDRPWAAAKEAASVVAVDGVDVPTGAWDIPPRDAIVVPIPGAESLPAFGSLVLGLNPYRRQDTDIAEFARLIAGQIGGALSNVAVLSAERQRAHMVWTHSRDLMVVVDANGVFQSVSPAWTRILGHEVDEVVGRPFDHYIVPEDSAASHGALSEAIGQAELTGYENRFRAVDGTPRTFSWHTVTAGDLVFAYGRDVTEQKASAKTLAETEAALRQAQKMEAVGQLTGGIAHDFNNLLMGISGGLELIERSLPTSAGERVERYIQGAQSSARRAAALTQRLLAFSRRQTLDPQPTDINKLIFGMEDLIRRTVGPGVEVEVVGQAGLWPARIDAAQLESALLNLAINARDAMPDGGRITIETANKWLDARGARERELMSGQFLSLCVTDTGVGIPREILDRIFDPFFTTKPIGEGTGLGLSMVHGFVRQSGGQVRVYSEVGAGTTVCLYLPRHLGAVQEAAIVESHVDELGRGEVVLVVDDENTVRMLMSDVLAEAGYAVIEASDGPSAIQVLQSDRQIDLLITDVGLPRGMNGRQVADIARMTRPGLKVLFVTGFAENAAVGNGHLPMGMEVLTKPFQVADLAKKVAEMIAT